MDTRLRIFGLSESQPGASDMIAVVQGQVAAIAHFESGEKGWTRAEFRAADGHILFSITHHRDDDEGVRQDLRTWAAWLETCEGNNAAVALMQHMISTRQVFVIDRGGADDCEVIANHVCLMVCRFLAAATDGVYQVDGQGFFAADGTLLVRED